jgi:hypothetical protein
MRPLLARSGGVTAWRNDRHLSEITDSGKSEAERGYCAVIGRPVGLDHRALPPGIARHGRWGSSSGAGPTSPGCSPVPPARLPDPDRGGDPCRDRRNRPTLPARRTRVQTKTGSLVRRRPVSPLAPHCPGDQVQTVDRRVPFVRWKRPVPGRVIPQSHDLFPTPTIWVACQPGNRPDGYRRG